MAPRHMQECNPIQLRPSDLEGLDGLLVSGDLEELTFLEPSICVGIRTSKGHG